MADLHPYDIIIRPVITEKSNVMASDENQYVFEVARNANKIQIKEAVEFIYNMEGEVLLVRTMVMPAKRGKRGRKFYIRQRPWKKAVVTLTPGNKIEQFSV